MTQMEPDYDPQNPDTSYLAKLEWELGSSANTDARIEELTREIKEVRLKLRLTPLFTGNFAQSDMWTVNKSSTTSREH